MSFKDHFSGHANQYQLGRPSYPKALFQALSKLTHSHELVWDCATGNGQAALGLAPYFDKVIASDASAEQVAQAKAREGVEYQVFPAECAELEDVSVDLVTVAQALHWFDFDSFFKEVKRVLKPGGVFAAWGYELIETEHEALNHLIQEFYSDVIGEYWPPERKLIQERYQNISFPFEKIEMPEMAIESNWSLNQLLTYLNTWSSVQRFQKKNGINPIDEWFRPRVEKFKFNASAVMSMNQPLFFLVGRQTNHL